MDIEALARDIAHATIGSLPALWVTRKISIDDTWVLREHIIAACKVSLAVAIQEHNKRLADAEGMVVQSQLDLLEQKRLAQVANLKLSAARSGDLSVLM